MCPLKADSLSRSRRLSSAYLLLNTYERVKKRREKVRTGGGVGASVKKSTFEKRVCGAAGAAGCVVVYRRNRVARYGTPRSLAARSRLLPAGRLHDTLFDICSPYRLTLWRIHGTSACYIALRENALE